MRRCCCFATLTTGGPWRCSSTRPSSASTHWSRRTTPTSSSARQRSSAQIVGINACDLDTFTIDRAAALELVASAPRDRVVVAESGITARAHGAAAELAGADAVLVGSALMRAPDPAAKLRELLARPLVKVCGLTRPEDVQAAADAGADMAGFILRERRRGEHPRYCRYPSTMLSVAVYVGERGDDASDLAQLYARENGHRGRDGVLFRADEPVARVIDRAWQEEDPGHIERARASEGRIMLAGGLSPENVGEAIATVRPWAVDASSSLETEPGSKDHDRIRAFVEAAR